MVCDSWSALDLAPYGFEERDRDGLPQRAVEPWFVRPPGALDAVEDPGELEVVRVSTPDELAEFELTSVRGFENEDATVETGSLHPAAIFADPRMTMLVGRVGGTAVSVAMRYRTETSVGIYGVTTIASARGRGYASGLTRAAIDPAMPVSLSPSPEAESLYRRRGFEPVGALRQWQRIS